MRTVLILVSIFTSLPISAYGRIACNDGFQSINGSEIATPYCQDEYLAVVARKYGMRVTGAAVRSDPQVKEDACRLVGHDIRMQDHCSRYNNNDRRH